MREMVANLAVMLRSSWQADRARSLGALVATGLLPVTRPLRAIGLALVTNGIVGGDRRQALTGAIVVALLTAASRMLEWASLTVRMRLRENTILFLDERVIELAAGAPGLEHHERPEHADEMELLRTDREYLVNPFMPVAWTIAAVVQIGATVAVLARMSPALALLPLAGVPTLVLTAVVERRYAAWRRDFAEETRRAVQLMELATLPAAAKEVRVFGLADELASRFRSVMRGIEREEIRLEIGSGGLLSLGWAIFALAYMGAVTFVVSEVFAGREKVGAIVLVLSLGAQINSQLSDLVQNMSWFTRTAQAVGRYRWLRAYHDRAWAALQRGDAVPVPERFVDGIRFRDVSFAYPGTDVAVLEGVDLHLPAGSTVAVVGENGAGKTTLVKLLLRFYEPTSGSITVDGVDLRQFAVGEWRAAASAGFQDFARFQLLARHSIGVGSLSALDDDAAVVDALGRASASDLPSLLPAGLDTHLGREFEDGGVDLSIGQWQKVAIGRAMMRQAPLLLALDEPTASLDAITEHDLFDRFAGAARVAARASGAITLLVSHRFSTVRMADVILVVDGGRVREAGSHEELVALGGLYAELYELQASSYR